MVSSMDKELPQLQPGQCMAICEDYENGTRYNLRRVIVTPAEKRCSRKAKNTIKSPEGELCFCNLHQRLCLEGFIDEKGVVLNRDMIRETRKGHDHALRRYYDLVRRGAKPKKPEPAGFYSWVRKNETP